MVLSNKKLKQNLRAARAEFLTAEVASVAFVGSSPETKTEPSGLRELLEAAKKHGPKLSKREKRRKTQSSLGLDGEIEIPISGNGEESEKVGDKGSKGEEKEVGLVDERGQNGKEEKKKIKKKKRKRGETEEKGLEAYGGEVKEAKNVKKKTKKKKKKKKKKSKTVEGEKKDDEEEVGAEAKDQVIESQIDEEVATKVYVGGIPYYSTEDDIRSYFEGCGTITEIDCMTFPDSGKFRGIAIISFKTDAAAKRALALDGSDMGGFYLKIKPYKTTRSNKTTQSNKVTNFAPDIVDGYNRIYCGNLSWDITEDDLKKCFSGCNIVSIRFGMDKDLGEFRGYAHVDFSDNSSVALALKLDQQIVCGRPIKVSRAIPPKKGVTIPPVAVPSSNESNDGGLSAGSGKKKRRTCYECGEKGHISTDCPRKQAADPTDSKTS